MDFPIHWQRWSWAKSTLLDTWHRKVLPAHTTGGSGSPGSEQLAFELADNLRRHGYLTSITVYVGLIAVTHAIVYSQLTRNVTVEHHYVGIGDRITPFVMPMLSLLWCFVKCVTSVWFLQTIGTCLEPTLPFRNCWTIWVVRLWVGPVMLKLPVYCTHSSVDPISDHFGPLISIQEIETASDMPS